MHNSSEFVVGLLIRLLALLSVGLCFASHTIAVALALRDFCHSALVISPFETYGQRADVVWVLHALQFTVATLNIIISSIITFYFPFFAIIYPPTNPSSNKKPKKI